MIPVGSIRWALKNDLVHLGNNVWWVHPAGVDQTASVNYSTEILKIANPKYVDGDGGDKPIIIENEKDGPIGNAIFPEIDPAAVVTVSGEARNLPGVSIQVKDSVGNPIAGNAIPASDFVDGRFDGFIAVSGNSVDPGIIRLSYNDGDETRQAELMVNQGEETICLEPAKRASIGNIRSVVFEEVELPGIEAENAAFEALRDSKNLWRLDNHYRPPEEIDPDKPTAEFIFESGDDVDFVVNAGHVSGFVSFDLNSFSVPKSEVKRVFLKCKAYSIENIDSPDDYFRDAFADRLNIWLSEKEDRFRNGEAIRNSRLISTPSVRLQFSTLNRRHEVEGGDPATPLSASIFIELPVTAFTENRTGLLVVHAEISPLLAAIHPDIHGQPGSDVSGIKDFFRIDELCIIRKPAERTLTPEALRSWDGAAPDGVYENGQECGEINFISVATLNDDPATMKVGAKAFQAFEEDSDLEADKFRGGLSFDMEGIGRLETARLLLSMESQTDVSLSGPPNPDTNYQVVRPVPQPFTVMPLDDPDFGDQFGETLYPENQIVSTTILRLAKKTHSEIAAAGSGDLALEFNFKLDGVLIGGVNLFPNGFWDLILLTSCLPAPPAAFGSDYNEKFTIFAGTSHSTAARRPILKIRASFDFP